MTIFQSAPFFCQSQVTRYWLKGFFNTWINVRWCKKQQPILLWLTLDNCELIFNLNLKDECAKNTGKLFSQSLPSCTLGWNELKLSAKKSKTKNRQSQQIAQKSQKWPDFNEGNNCQKLPNLEKVKQFMFGDSLCMMIDL